MKVIILAGGFGTRLSEYTKRIPKPMVKIAGYPIIIHIIKHYMKYGLTDFYIAAGYKSNEIKNTLKISKKMLYHLSTILIKKIAIFQYLIQVKIL